MSSQYQQRGATLSVSTATATSVIVMMMLVGVACVGRQLLLSVGGFFGLTEASQRGDGNEIGWQEFTERNIEVCSVSGQGF